MVLLFLMFDGSVWPSVNMQVQIKKWILLVTKLKALIKLDSPLKFFYNNLFIQFNINISIPIHILQMNICFM
jgi:hypothetical protein